MSLDALMRCEAHPLRITGALIEVPLRHLRIGEVCDIYRSWRDNTVTARAVVLSLQSDSALLSLLGSADGLTRDAVVSPTGKGFTLTLSTQLQGAVIAATGEVVARLADAGDVFEQETRDINAPPPGFHQRVNITDPFFTGVRAIDALIPCGRGQRMGIFAAAGCGKTTLMEMIINQASADIFVVALIGERGREVTEFTEALRASPHAGRCVVVYATSDFSAADRMNAALIAMTIAEYFRDRGKHVVLFLDSVSRYARALRDVALLTGEPPARRGYPASVFERLPALLERPGVTQQGSITAFFTILMESEDESDPVAEEIRSILDGHILLSRKLAAANHYPAIDVLRSLSRVSTRVCQSAHLDRAGQFRQILSQMEALQTLIEFGEYQPGQQEENDRLYALMPAYRAFLCQSRSDAVSVEHSLQRLYDLTQ